MTETTTTTTTPAVPDDGEERIPLKLSNHLTWAGVDRKPGETVQVTRDEARSIIAAGYAAVDPEDTEAVTKALRLGSYATTPAGQTVDYGPEGEGAPVDPVPAATGDAAEAQLDPREGRSDTADDTWTVAELQRLLRVREQPVSGTKDELLDRLADPDAGDAGE